LLESYLAKTPEVLFCPGSDQVLSAKSELAKVGKKQAQSSYYYRHGGNTNLFEPKGGVPEPPLRLGDLGDNRKGKPIRALVIDTLFIAPDTLKSFGVLTLTSHKRKFANVLYMDGRVSSLNNADGRFTIDVTDYSKIRGTFGEILSVFEKADEEG
jgi:prepilin-type processing-associated H-X9-DG protein